VYYLALADPHGLRVGARLTQAPLSGYASSTVASVQAGAGRQSTAPRATV